MTDKEKIKELRFQLQLAIDALRLADKAIPGASLKDMADSLEKKANENS
jgi:hypothetical protein